MRLKYSYNVRPGLKAQAYISIPNPAIHDLVRIVETLAYLHDRPNFKVELL